MPKDSNTLAALGRRWLAAFIVVIAAMCVAASAAQAALPPETHAAGAQASAAALPAISQDLRSPDARDAGTVSQAQDFRSPDARDAAQAATNPGPATGSSSNDFDWGYVGGGVLLALAMATSLVAITRHRRHQTGGQRFAGMGHH